MGIDDVGGENSENTSLEEHLKNFWSNFWHRTPSKSQLKLCLECSLIEEENEMFLMVNQHKHINCVFIFIFQSISIEELDDYFMRGEVLKVEW